VAETDTSFLKNVDKFRQIGYIPTSFPFAESDTELFIEKCASWHKTCKLKFKNAKLDWAKKKRRADASSTSTTPSRRQAHVL